MFYILQLYKVIKYSQFSLQENITGLINSIVLLPPYGDDGCPFTNYKQNICQIQAKMSIFYVIP
jgi:hypothetical protein